MLISGFTFLRNAHKLHYPIKESIISILKIVDEFVIALGEGDENDSSLSILQSINSDKIKIINTKWEVEKYKNGTIYANQTDIAKKHCKGHWLLYLQGDEVIHEIDTIEIVENCNKFKNNESVEGFVFNYLHFYGDYDHYFANHCWYKNEIRLIRNLPQIHSWRDAQSFRFVFKPEEFNYQKSAGSRKLNCVKLNARIFHYGWVRPPEFMSQKNNQASINYNIQSLNKHSDLFDYGRMDYCKVFQHTHPAVMKDKIEKLYWKEKLRYSGPIAINRPTAKHEKLKYRLLSWIEEKLLGGHVIGGFKNYKLLNLND
jgi:hypothetical protein